MQIGIPKETFAGEARVAGSPETVKKFIKLGVDVYVAENAGNSAYFSDLEFETAGAKICSQTEAFQKELVLKVRTPQKAELNELKSGTTMVGMLEPHNKEYLAEIAKRGITAFALESAPRTPGPDIRCFIFASKYCGLQSCFGRSQNTQSFSYVDDCCRVNESG